jgi:hypothetical protein
MIFAVLGVVSRRAQVGPGVAWFWELPSATTAAVAPQLPPDLADEQQADHMRPANRRPQAGPLGPLAAR